MGAPSDSEQTPIGGLFPVRRVAESYLGSLWIAVDRRGGGTGKPVLLRRLQLPSGAAVEVLQRLACAGRDAMALNHENVLPVVGVVQEQERLAMAYAYADAEPLRSLQTLAGTRRAVFPVGVSLRITIDMLRGVKALHGALLGWPSAPPFGGIAPDSVLVSRDGRTRICDPLISSCATLLEGVGLNAAKLAYAAPEQVHATEPLAPALDVFACAAILWELLAGRPRLTGTQAAIERRLLEHSLPSLSTQLGADAKLSPKLVQLVERSLSWDPGKRPRGPGELALELEQCGQEVASHAEVAAFVADLAGAQRGSMVFARPAGASGANWKVVVGPESKPEKSTLEQSPPATEAPRSVRGSADARSDPKSPAQTSAASKDAATPKAGTGAGPWSSSTATAGPKSSAGAGAAASAARAAKAEAPPESSAAAPLSTSANAAADAAGSQNSRRIVPLPARGGSSASIVAARAAAAGSPASSTAGWVALRAPEAPPASAKAADSGVAAGAARGAGPTPAAAPASKPKSEQQPAATSQKQPAAAQQTAQKPAAPASTAQPAVQAAPEPATPEATQKTAGPASTLQPAVQPAAQPAAQQAKPPAAQPAAQQAKQPAAQPAAQKAKQPAAQPAAQQTAQKPAAGASTLQPAVQTAAQPVAQPAAQKPAGGASMLQPAVQPAPQKTAAQPATSTAQKPAGRASTVQPAVQPAAQPVTQAAAQKAAAQKTSAQAAAQPAAPAPAAAAPAATGQPGTPAVPRATAQKIAGHAAMLQAALQPAPQPVVHATGQKPAAQPTVQSLAPRPAARASALQPAVQPTAQKPAAQPAAPGPTGHAAALGSATQTAAKTPEPEQPIGAPRAPEQAWEQRVATAPVMEPRAAIRPMAAAPRPERKSELQPTSIAPLQAAAPPAPITVAGMDQLPALEAPRPAANKPSAGAAWPLEDSEISDALEPMFAVPSEAPVTTMSEAPAIAVPSDASSLPSVTATEPPLTTEDTEPMFPDPSEAPTETLTSLAPPPVSETSTTLDVSNVLPHAERGTGAEARVSVVPAKAAAGGPPLAAASSPEASGTKRSQAATLIVQRRAAPSPSHGAPSSHDASGWSHPPGPASGGLLRGRAVLGGIAAAVALSIAAGVALFLRQGGPELSAAPAPSAAARASKPAMPEPAEPGPSAAPPSRPTDTDAADAAAPLAAADAPKATPAPPASDRVLPDGDFDGVALKDERLVQLFAFEQRAKQPSCAERLGPSGRRLAANNTKKSQAALKAARKALVRGDNTKAHVLLCTAVAHQAANVAAWQALAELMLNLGDPAQAKQAAEQALKSKPQDRDLLGIVGDAWAMLGDLQQSRAFWARCLPVKGPAGQRDARLAALFGGAGDRLLRTGSHSAALVFYRRAVVLSAGARAPSAGMAEALRRLHQAQAEKAWTERVARAFPAPKGGQTPPAGG